MGLLKKARSALKQAFPPPAKINLQDEDGIIGVVTSKQFRGLDFIDRQDRIWDVLDKVLEPEERKRVVTIIAVTPEEEAAHLGR